MATHIGDLAIAVTAEIGGLVRGMDQARDVVKGRMNDVRNTVNSVSGAFKELGVAVSIGAFVKFSSDLLKSVAALDDMAESTGATVEGLSRIQQVANKTGQDFGQVQGAITKLTKSLSPLNSDSKKVETALKAIGLTISDLQRLRPDQQFETVAKALDQFEDSGQKAQVAMALLGKTGAEYLPLLKELAQDQETQANVTTKMAEEAEKLEKQWASLTTQAINFVQRGLLYANEGYQRLFESMKKFGTLQGTLDFFRGDTGGATRPQLMARIEKLQRDLETSKTDKEAYDLGKEILRLRMALPNEETPNAKPTINLPPELKTPNTRTGGRSKIDTTEQDAYNRSLDEGARLTREATKELDALTKQREQLDEVGFVGSQSYMRFLKDNFDFERSAWTELSRDREDEKNKQLKAEEDAAKKAADDWQKASDNINNSLTDALMRGFESGSDFAKTFVDTVRNLFNTLVLRPIISAMVQPVANATLGLIGMGASGGAAASGGIGNVGNLLGGLGQAFGGGAGMAYIGNSIIGGSFGAGLSFGSTGVMGAIQGVGAMAATGSVAGTAGAVMGVIGAAAPYIAAAMAIYSLFAKQGGGPKTEMRGGAQMFDTPGRYGLDPGLDAGVSAVAEQYKRIVTASGGTPHAFQGMVRLALDPAGDSPNQIMSGVKLDDTLITRSYKEQGRPDNAQEQVTEELTRMLVASLQATDLYDAIDAIFDAVDPSTASVEALNAALSEADAVMQGMAQATVSYAVALQQVVELMQSTHNMFTGSIEQIRMSRMTEEQQYGYLSEQVQLKRDVMAGLIDPTLIAEYAGQINDRIMQMYSMLGPDQQALVADQFIAELEAVDKLANDRYTSAASFIEERFAALPAEMKASIDAAMDRAVERIAAAIPQRIGVDVRVAGSVESVETSVA